MERTALAIVLVGVAFSTNKRVLEALRIRHRLASVYSYVSFGTAILRNHFHLQKDCASVMQRQRTLREFADFLVESGINEKLYAGFLNSRVFSNLLILHRIHKIVYGEKIDDEPPTVVESDNNQEDLETAYRIFKFSVVVYGHDVSVAVEHESQLLNNPDSILYRPRHRRQSQILCEKTGVCKPADILVRNWEYGGNSHFINHTVVVDHAFQQIIFAIRGTLSLSDALVDLEANSVDFCGGQAHAGMARMARSTWAAATEKHGNHWEVVPDHYELVITGHSLGAGVATLIAVMVLHEKLVNRPVRCFAYAPPATFYGDLPNTVSSRISAFSFGNDFVSNFSVYNSLRMNSMLAAVDKKRKTMGFLDTWKLVAGWLEPSRELRDAVTNCSVDTVPGTPPLAVVANKFVWFRKTKGGFSVSDRSRDGPMILSGLGMFTHHTPGKLETAFQTVLHEPRSTLVRRISRFMPKQLSQRFFE